MKLSSKHTKALKAIFDNPVRSDVEWKKIESLLSALGSELSEGRESRIRVALVKFFVYEASCQDPKTCNKYI